MSTLFLIYKDIAIGKLQICRFQPPHSSLTTVLREIPYYLRIFVVGSEKRIFLQQSAYRPFRARSSKVNDFGTSRKRIRDFVLVIQKPWYYIIQACAVSGIRRLISSKLQIFPTGLPMFPLEVRCEVYQYRKGTRVIEVHNGLFSKYHPILCSNCEQVGRAIEPMGVCYLVC